MNDATSERAEQAPIGDLTLLTRWSRWFAWIMLFLGVFFVSLYFLFRSPASLILAAVMLLIFCPAAYYGVRETRAGRAGPALAAIGFCCWTLGLLVAARGHTALPAALPLSLLPVIFALPYVNRTVLLRIAIAALVVCTIEGALTIAPPLLASRIDETTLAIIMVPIIVVSAGLAIFGLWYVGSMLRSSLRETKNINARLANSERELERQVESRTEALQKAVSELSDIEEISRAVNVNLELDGVIRAIQSALQRVVHFDNLSVLLLDKENKRLMVDHVAGIDINAEKHQKILEHGVSAIEENSVFAAVIERRHPILTADIGEEQLASMASSDRFLYDVNPVRSLLICPLEFVGKVIGVMILARKSEPMSLSVEEVSRIQRYIAPLAIVIRNARLLEEAELARAEAMESSTAKSQFLANMSHELRTPLNAIIGYSELLAEDAEEAGHEQYLDDLDKILSSGRYLMELIRGVLDLTKIEVGKLEVSAADFDVGDLIHDVAGTSKPLAEKESNELQIENDGDLGSMCSDLTKVRQVLLNLMSNACKFTQKGCIRLVTRRETRDDGDWMIFNVEDNGIGMTDAQLDRIFDAFTQADESTSRRYGGTGLGLTISREFCELLGGEIHVVSEDGKGSTFTVSLPARAPAAP